MATEKRLIDANAADVERIPCYYGDRCYTEDVQAWLDEQPTVDAVEVVRCKDCIYFHETVDGYTSCMSYRGIDFPRPYDFCYYGERRTDD